MRPTQVGLAALVALLTPALGDTLLAAQAPANPVHFEDLADGVFVALQSDARRFNESASTVVIGTRGVLVVDAQADPDAVRTTLAEIRRRTELPVRWVINTHWHADHTQGNWIYREAFGEGVELVAHETVADDIEKRAAPDLEARIERIRAQLPAAEKTLEEGVNDDGTVLDEPTKQRFAEQIERARAWVERNSDVHWVPPTIGYSQTMSLDLGNRSVELRHFRAHTRGDTVVYLPAERILLTGDVLDDLPYVGHGYPSSWIDALEAIAKMEVALYVPGHGAPYRDARHLEDVQAYLRALEDGVRAAIAAGVDRASLAEHVDLGGQREALAKDDPVAADFFDATLEEALQRTYDELTGTLSD